MYTIEKKQWIDLPISKAWYYFSNPGNLSEITPDDMGFKIRNKPPEEMYEGAIIVYTVSPIFKIPLKWVTEITHIKKENYFVDEQRSGPFKMWHHEHHFEEKDGGTQMRDIIHYDLPMGFLGKIAHGISVRSKLQKIFGYREKMLDQTFNHQ